MPVFNFWRHASPKPAPMTAKYDFRVLKLVSGLRIKKCRGALTSVRRRHVHRESIHGS